MYVQLVAKFWPILDELMAAGAVLQVLQAAGEWCGEKGTERQIDAFRLELQRTDVWVLVGQLAALERYAEVATGDASWLVRSTQALTAAAATQSALFHPTSEY